MQEVCDTGNDEFETGSILHHCVACTLFYG